MKRSAIAIAVALVLGLSLMNMPRTQAAPANLSKGSSGDDVKQLQTLLKEKGYFTYSSITGYFGTITEQAVIAYQKDHGIPSTGVVASLTWASLGQSGGSSGGGGTPTETNTVLTLGTRGDQVSELQQRLKSTGYYSYSSITGYYGPITYEAVKAFQRAKGLSVDGMAGPKTLAALGMGGGSSSTPSPSPGDGGGSTTATQTAKVTATALNVRQSASTSSSVLGTVRKGQTLQVVKKASDSWYQIEYNGGVGYVHASYISLSGSTGTGGGTTTENVTGTVTASSLNVRQSASTSSAVVGGLKKGDTVTIMTATGSWYQISFNGGSAYVHKDYVKTNGTPSTPETPPPSSTPGTVTNLTIGSRGDMVTQLQQKLKDLGYYTYSTITGYYGTITQDAVKRYQKAAGLSVDGIAGKNTLTQLGLVGGTATDPSPSPSPSPGGEDPGTTSEYRWPASGVVTSEFGARWGKFHHGIDIANNEGTPIYASKAGVVKYAGELGDYGLAINIDHGDGTTTRYAHCSALLVKAGERVTQQTQIAKMGSTGNSTGDHVHFEVFIGSTRINPREVLP